MSQAKQENCLFCDVLEIDRDRIVEENDLAFVVRDGFPVTQYHTLLIPKRHELDYFGLNTAEVSAIHLLLHSQKKLLSEQDVTIAGYNIGMNCGKDAGQTVFHFHCHIIPRYSGDVEDPRGGVRHSVIGKGYY